MKVNLSPNELVWLDHYIEGLVKVASSRDDAQSVARTAQKMRYKFRGASSYVWLSRKERQLLLDLARHRFATINAQPTEEREVVKGLVETLELSA